MNLHLIRNDFARPTVTARNLFHTSVAMWDSYAAFDKTDKAFFVDAFLKTNSSEQLKKYRNTAISYAAFTVLKHRYKNAPGNSDFNANKLTDYLNFTMRQFGYNPNHIINTALKTPADIGLFIGQKNN